MFSDKLLEVLDYKKKAKPEEPKAEERNDPDAPAVDKLIPHHLTKEGKKKKPKKEKIPFDPLRDEEGNEVKKTMIFCNTHSCAVFVDKLLEKKKIPHATLHKEMTAAVCGR